MNGGVDCKICLNGYCRYKCQVQSSLFGVTHQNISVRLPLAAEMACGMKGTVVTGILAIVTMVTIAEAEKLGQCQYFILTGQLV